MKKYTVAINNNDEQHTARIERTETELDAIFTAWEAKMTGKTVKVVNDESLKTVYC